MMPQHKRQRGVVDTRDAGQALSGELLTVVEGERKRIALELHDSVGQMLTSIRMRAERALSDLESGKTDAAKKRLTAVVQMVQGTMAEVRQISVNLRPAIIDDLGIIATIRWFCREFAASQPDLQVKSELKVAERAIPERAKIVLYRVLQEAMNNIAKHSGAHRARVRLSYADDQLEFLVEDNGRGFDMASALQRRFGTGGLGLRGMQKRVETVGGKFLLQSKKDRGTIVRVLLPAEIRHGSARNSRPPNSSNGATARSETSGPGSAGRSL